MRDFTVLIEQFPFTTLESVPKESRKNILDVLHKLQFDGDDEMGERLPYLDIRNITVDGYVIIYRIERDIEFIRVVWVEALPF